VDAVDLVFARLYHERLVGRVQRVRAGALPTHFRGGTAYVIDLRGLNASGVQRTMAQVAESVGTDQLSTATFRELR
jgi:hypothetical protein